MVAFAALAPLLGAGITGAASFMAGNAQAEAAELNNAISLLNYYNQVNAQNRAIQESRRQQADARLGQTDAAGNRTHFIPGVGWVTDLSDDQQAILDATEAEQLRQATETAARAEQTDARAVGRRNREDTSATEAERAFRQARRPDADALRQLYLARGAEQRNRQADRAGELSSRHALRTGGHNASSIRQGARAEADADSARQAGVEATMMARQNADAQFAQDRDQANALYNYFRNASTAGPAAGATQFAPGGPPRTSDAMANQMLANAVGRHAEFDYQRPNTGMADALASTGQAFGAGFDRFQQAQFQQQMLDAFGRANTGSAGLF